MPKPQRETPNTVQKQQTDEKRQSASYAEATNNATTKKTGKISHISITNADRIAADVTSACQQKTKKRIKMRQMRSNCNKKASLEQKELETGKLDSGQNAASEMETEENDSDSSHSDDVFETPMTKQQTTNTQSTSENSDWVLTRYLKGIDHHIIASINKNPLRFQKELEAFLGVPRTVGQIFV